jgi:hypothetical protein
MIIEGLMIVEQLMIIERPVIVEFMIYERTKNRDQSESENCYIIPTANIGKTGRAHWFGKTEI